MGVFDNLPGPFGGGSEEDSGEQAAEEPAADDPAGMTPPDVRDRAETLAARSDVPTLDYTVPSLEALDDLIAGPTSPVDDRLAYGSYLGETLVRSYDGRWVREDGDPVVAVPLPDGDQTTVDVFGAARMALERGPVFGDVAGRLDEQGAERRDPGAVEPVGQETFADSAREAVGEADAESADPEAQPAESPDETPPASDAESETPVEADDQPLAPEPTEGWGREGDAEADESPEAATPDESPVETEPGDSEPASEDEAGAETTTAQTPLRPSDTETSDEQAAGDAEPTTPADDAEEAGAGEADETEADRAADDVGAAGDDAEAVATTEEDGEDAASAGPPEWATHRGSDDWAPPAPDEGSSADRSDPSEAGQPAPSGAETDATDADDGGATASDVADTTATGDDTGAAPGGAAWYESGGDTPTADEPSEPAASDTETEPTTIVDESTPPAAESTGTPTGPPPRRALADAAETFADRWPDREFDFSPRSLQRVDHFITDQWGGRFDRDSFDPPVHDLDAAAGPLVRVAAYFGTVMVRALPAEWTRDDTGEPAIEVTGRGEESTVVSAMAVTRDALVDRPLFRYHFDATVNELGLDAEAASDAGRAVFDVDPGTPSAAVVPDILEAGEDFSTDWDVYGLDYSPDSLADLDYLVDAEFDAEAFADATLGDETDVDSLLLTAQANGSAAYFAAVCVRHLDAQWLIREDVLLNVEGPEGEYRVDPLEVAESCLRGTRSFEDRYEWIRDRVGL